MSSASLDILMTADAVGGVWTYAVELGGALVDRGHDVTLAICGPAPSADQRGQAEAAGLGILPDELPLDWLCEGAAPVVAGGERLEELARGFDLLLLNSPALAAHGNFSIPVIAVAHGEVGTWWDAVGADGEVAASFGWLLKLIGQGLRRAAQVVTPTAAYGTMLRHRYALNVQPLTVYNGRTPLNPPAPRGERPFALTVGRFWDRAKNIGIVNEAAALRSLPIYAVGSATGPHGEQADLSQLHHLGSIAPLQLAALLAERPVFVSSATYEPFGLAALEAAQAGCPLILSDIPTFRELWEGAATFVAPHDAQGFAKAIDDPQVSGRAAQERASHYTVEAMTDRMLDVIASALPQRCAA